MTTNETSPPRLSYAALFARFLRFGLGAFGGPVAQIAMLRQALVEEERWIAPARFNRLLAVFQVLPGPEAHELCVHLGMMARGRIGGVLAGLGFMLPGLVLILGAAWLYTRLLGAGIAQSSALLGVQIVVIAVIVRAVARIASHVLEERWLWAVAGGAAAATLAGVPFWLPLVVSGAAASVKGRWRAVIGIAGAVAALAWWWSAGESARIDVAMATPATTLALFVAGLKGGLLTFGGAYTAIPYVRNDTVGRGWISDASFLDGVALANVLPAPLVIFATFAGYLAGGFAGALAITAGMFLPAFAFSLIFYERLEALVEAPALHRFLGGVAAAVVGIIAATSVQLAASTAERVTQPSVAIAMFGAALLAVWRLKGPWVVPALVAAGAAIGWLARP